MTGAEVGAIGEKGAMGGKKTIFLYEPHAGSAKRTVSVIEELGYLPLAASTSEEATAVLEDEAPIAALVASDATGLELGQYIREFSDISAPLAVVVGADDDGPAAAEELGADAYLRRPVAAEALRVFIESGARILAARSELARVEGELSKLQEKVERRRSGVRSDFHHFDEVKDLLVVEVRRAKRYGYPLAILLVGIDPVDSMPQLKLPTTQREIVAGLAVAISKSVRLIDLPIHYADDRVLVFLPHTDLAGAVEVGRRIKRRIKRITYRREGLVLQLTASVGVAGISIGDDLTFSKLVKTAAAALKAAQLKGGDKVMKRVSG